jgi:hypothetical protein
MGSEGGADVHLSLREPRMATSRSRTAAAEGCFERSPDGSGEPAGGGGIRQARASWVLVEWVHDFPQAQEALAFSPPPE